MVASQFAAIPLTKDRPTIIGTAIDVEKRMVPERGLECECERRVGN